MTEMDCEEGVALNAGAVKLMLSGAAAMDGTGPLVTLSVTGKVKVGVKYPPRMTLP